MIQKVSSLLFLILPAAAFCQLPSSQCDSAHENLESCPYVVEARHELAAVSNSGDVAQNVREDVERSARDSNASSDSNSTTSSMFVQPAAPKYQGFHWGRALFESFAFLSIEQAYVVHEDYRWVVVENGVPLNHYWRD